MNLGKSWTTTGAGIACMLTAIGAALSAITDSDPLTNIDMASLIAAVIAGVGLIMAKDSGAQ